MTLKYFYIIIGVIGTALALVLIFLPKGTNDYKYRAINNFEECARAGYPVMESYPRQCRIPEGEIFVEELTEGEKRNLEPPIEKTCEDLCGDSVCQEIVCMAIGCPCAETPTSCPQDCSD